MTEINDFVKNLNLIISKIVKSPDDFYDKTKYFEYVWRFQNSLIFPYSIYNEFNFCIKILNEKVKRKFGITSLEEIKKIFIDFLFTIVYDNQNKQENLSNLHKISSKLFDKIKHIEFFKFIVIVPLVNIKSEIPLEVGQCKITNLSKIKIQELNNLYKINLAIDDHYNEEWLINEIQGNYRFPTIAITEVIATDSNKAEQIALFQIEQSLNILRFYIPTFRGLIKGEEVQEIKRTLITAKINDINEVSYPAELCNMAIDPSRPDEIINLDLITKLNNEYFEKINELFNKPIDSLNQLEKDLITVIYWVGDAAKDNRNIHKLIKYILVLDTLLAQGHSNKSEFVAKSISSIINKTTPEKIVNDYYKIKAYYGLRNQVMHAGLINIDNKDFDELRNLITELICFLFLYSTKFSNIKDLQSSVFPIRDDIFNSLNLSKNEN